MEKMYKGIANSPESFLREKLTEDSTILYIVDDSIIPEIPNILVIGDAEKAETVLVESKREDNGLNIQRALEGNAIAWEKGTKVARNFTNYDYQVVINNINTLDSTKLDATNAVYKEEGKGLSTNDYTNEDKKEVAKIKNKADKSEIKTSLSQLTDDETHRLVTDAEKAKWDNKLDSTNIGGAIIQLDGEWGAPLDLQLNKINQKYNALSDIVNKIPEIEFFKYETRTPENSIYIIKIEEFALLCITKLKDLNNIEIPYGFRPDREISIPCVNEASTFFSGYVKLTPTGRFYRQRTSSDSEIYKPLNFVTIYTIGS